MIATQLCPLYTYYRGCDAEVQKGEIEFLYIYKVKDKIQLEYSIRIQFSILYHIFLLNFGAK